MLMTDIVQEVRFERVTVDLCQITAKIGDAEYGVSMVIAYPGLSVEQLLTMLDTLSLQLRVKCFGEAWRPWAAV